MVVLKSLVGGLMCGVDGIGKCKREVSFASEISQLSICMSVKRRGEGKFEFKSTGHAYFAGLQAGFSVLCVFFH